ncbi:Imm44 family immunity protein [Chryseobacterium oryctis]|uniref:Imm44 family immunity protein n=1 Tax=Chryseobacterium oryctis TaxID=2952618 RepID=A0ABT3HST5_9FLAO|nr:Imm44 family immunity protein [Chryseobacterium oryctis]MCW3162845.1 Imm44 family immunity protein [Chryseobacterium oryctis]
MNFGLAITISREITNTNIITELSDDMERYLKNKNYGNDIKEVVIGIICVSQGFEQFYKPKKARYTKDKKIIKSEGFEYEIEKCLEYSIKLDFEEFQSSSEEERKKIISREILLSLDTLESIKKKIKDFNWEQFKQDLENYFNEKGLL